MGLGGGTAPTDASALPVPAAVPALVPDPPAPAVAPPVTQGEPVAVPDDCPTWEQAEPPGPPCPTCSGLAYWLDLADPPGRHCQRCEAGKLAAAVRLLDRRATPPAKGKALAMKQRKPAREPWPPPELCLPSLDELERISRGVRAEPEPPSPPTWAHRPGACGHSRRRRQRGRCSDGTWVE